MTLKTNIDPITAFLRRVHAFIDLTDENDEEKNERRLEYSLALSVIFITFGFWFFDFVKHQTYFTMYYAEAFLILAISTISVFSGTLMMIHIVLEGICISGIIQEAYATEKYIEYLSSRFFLAAFMGIYLFLFIAIAYTLSLPFYLISQLTKLAFVQRDGLYLVIGFILAIMALDAYVSVNKRKKIKKSVFHPMKTALWLIILFSSIFLLYPIAFYFLDNSLTIDVQVDKQIYNINEDKIAIITFKGNSIFSIPANFFPNTPYGYYIIGPNNSSYFFLMHLLPDLTFVGVFPLENKTVGRYTLNATIKTLSEHKNEVSFILCNTSREIPCFSDEEILALMKILPNSTSQLPVEKSLK